MSVLVTACFFLNEQSHIVPQRKTQEKLTKCRTNRLLFLIQSIDTKYSIQFKMQRAVRVSDAQESFLSTLNQ